MQCCGPPPECEARKAGALFFDRLDKGKNRAAAVNMKIHKHKAGEVRREAGHYRAIWKGALAKPMFSSIGAAMAYLDRCEKLGRLLA